MAQEGRPQLAETPLGILTNDPEREIPLLNKYWGVVAGTGAGFLSVIYSNWGARRPQFSGVQRHVMFAVIGGAIGYYADAYRSQYMADKDAGLRHYIQLHPEDFPPFKRQKFADLLDPWIPIRGE